MRTTLDLEMVGRSFQSSLEPVSSRWNSSTNSETKRHDYLLKEIWESESHRDLSGG